MRIWPRLQIYLLVVAVLAWPVLARPVPALADSNCLILGSSLAYRDRLYSVVIRNTIFALRHAGICVEEKALPAARVPVALKHGEIDGDVLRVGSFKEVVGDAAFPVEEPILEGIGYLVTRDGAIRSVADLGARPLGILRGTVWHAAISEGAERTTEANSYDQLVEMFAKRRVDAFLIDEYNLPRFPDLGKNPRVPVTRQQAFIFLHASRQSMAGLVVDALRTYKRHGCVFTQPDGGARCALMPYLNTTG